MTTIQHLADTKPHHVSRNLRGLVDYARKYRVVCIITRKEMTADTYARGELRVVFSDGGIGDASFASFEIMIDWVRNRRTWRERGAVVRNIDTPMGYLTQPGTLAGPALKPRPYTSWMATLTRDQMRSL